MIRHVEGEGGGAMKSRRESEYKSNKLHVCNLFACMCKGNLFIVHSSSVPIRIWWGEGRRVLEDPKAKVQVGPG